eukprot:scaffold1486_cov329-Prasinococcus_capsulatus_cf.AAC.9
MVGRTDNARGVSPGATRSSTPCTLVPAGGDPTEGCPSRAVHADVARRPRWNKDGCRVAAATPCAVTAGGPRCEASLATVGGGGAASSNCARSGQRGAPRAGSCAWRVRLAAFASCLRRGTGRKRVRHHAGRPRSESLRLIRRRSF